MAKRVPYPPVHGFWNLGGGVGKTTLSFHMATTYAELFPNKAVVAIDMCPEANLSATLLTNTMQTGRKPGIQVVRDMQYDKKAQEDIPKTVGGYLLARLMDKTVPAQNFLINVWGDNHNSHVPSNLALVCGDSGLDLVNSSLSARASELPNRALRSAPFRNIHCYLRDFIQKLAEWFANSKKLKELVVFIDTNPAFCMYTKIALCAMTELVVPVSSYTFSLQAVSHLYHLVYGLCPQTSTAASAAEEPPLQASDTFADQAKANSVALPCITAIIHNRNAILQDPTPQSSGQCQPLNCKAEPKAMRAMLTEQCSELFEGYVEAKNSGKLERVFAVKKSADKSSIECKNITEFANCYTATMKDLNSTGVAALYSGIPLWKLLEKLNCIDSQFRGLNFRHSVPGLIKDLLYAMEVMLGAAQWADKDAQAMKRLEAIADPQPTQVLRAQGNMRAVEGPSTPRSRRPMAGACSEPQAATEQELKEADKEGPVIPAGPAESASTAAAAQPGYSLARGAKKRKARNISQGKQGGSQSQADQSGGRKRRKPWV